MRYYTKDWYKKIQISSFLMFPQTKKEWEEEIEFYKREGIDIQQNYKEEFDLIKDDLLKFLPPFFEPYIKNESIKSKYPSQELKKQIDIWTKELERDNDLFEEKYIKEYNSIKYKLPKDVIKICERSLHDSNIESIKNVSDSLLTITLETKGSFNYKGRIKLIFTGVKQRFIPKNIDNSYWLQNEIYITDEGFEFNILLDLPLSEIKIVADNMLIKKL